MPLEPAFTDTVEFIITTALRHVRAIPPSGDVPQLAGMKLVALDILNSIVQGLQSNDVFLWNSSSVNKILTPGQASYSYPDIILLAYAFMVTYDGADYKVTTMSIDDYRAIADKSSSGIPQSIVLDIKPSSYSFTLYPVPDKQCTLTYTVITPHPSYIVIGDVHGFPVYWVNALTWALTAELASMYDIPVEERLLFERIARTKLDIALSYKANHSGSIFIKPARR